jgi:class 3 adenylate cyclase
MFADMTGYTRLSSQLPLDEVNGIVERYFGAFLEEILAQGGDVNETAGDGLMVLFQHDDPREHARAAVRAAAGIQRITRSLNAERVGAIPIGVHIGINSGIASVGATKIQAGAGMRWTYTASGSTTNTAARIGALGHEIAITGETRSRLAGGFALEDLGEQALKNVARPVRVFRVQTPEAPSAAAAPARAAPVASGELGGRGVRGVLREAGSGRPLAGYRIRVFDKDLIRDDFLGEALCDGEGRFQLRFAPGSSPGLLEGHLDLYLRVIDPQVEREVWSTATEIRKAELDVETFEVEVPPHRLV